MAVELLNSCEAEVLDLIISKIDSDHDMTIEQGQLKCNGIFMDYEDFIVVTQIKQQINDIINNHKSFEIDPKNLFEQALQQ